MLQYEDIQELIAASRKEGKLYHYNGGQAYIRPIMESNVLMVVDHSIINSIRIILEDGSDYFKHNQPYSKVA
jgi:hypothetical protein